MFKLPEEIKIQLEKNYKTSLEEYLKGIIPKERFRGIRVPWGIYSHRGGKVFMMRIRIPGGFLTTEQLKAISLMAEKYGNKYLHITTRQDIQIHEVKIEDTYNIMDFLKEYNLSPRGGGGNTIRNITCCPFSGICKYEIFDVRSYAISLSEYLLRKEESYNLPRKFKIAFSGCSFDCAKALVNDVGFISKSKNGKIGFSVYAGGGMGAISMKGKLLEDFILPEDVGYVIETIKNIYYFNGDRKDRHHNRLRFFIEKIGFDNFKELYKNEFKKLKEEEFISLRDIRFNQPDSFEQEEIPIYDDERYKDFLNYNIFHQKQNGFVSVILRIPRGDIFFENGVSIAELKKDFENIELRTTQSQNIVINWILKKDVYKIYRKLVEIFGYEFLYPETLLDVTCCKGALTCNLGLCNSVGLAKEIEKLIEKRFLKKNIFDKFNIKINGCPNACGQHPIGNISFHGVVRKVYGRSVPFYKFLIGGKARGDDTLLAEEIGIIPAKNIISFLDEFLTKIEENGFVNLKEIGKELLKNYQYVPSYSENPEFYRDWGKDEDFSLSGLSQGECGAGVIDMIESDIEEAKIYLEKCKNELTYQNVKNIIYLSARALLVVRGIDPKVPDEVFDSFVEKFIKDGIADEKYLNIKEIYNSINENLKDYQLEEKLEFAKEFFEYIVELYKSMDSTFNFPKRIESKGIEKEEKETKIIDLRGTPCPINYVKAKLFIENLEKGDIIEILLDEGAPIENVPKSLENDGHKILNISKIENYYIVKVERG